jgi:hypothetical protein
MQGNIFLIWLFLLMSTINVLKVQLSISSVLSSAMESWHSRHFNEAPLSIWLIGNLLILKLFPSINLHANPTQILQVADSFKLSLTRVLRSWILTMSMVTVTIMTLLILANHQSLKLKEYTSVKKVSSINWNSNTHLDLEFLQNTMEPLAPSSMVFMTTSI